MSKHFNECPYGVGQYVDRLLDEKITLNKQQVLDHINNGDVHVTLEDKERWNSVSEAVLNSSSTDDDGTPTIEIPTLVSQLENDVPYVTLDDMSRYATEDEVRMWLGDYVTKQEYQDDQNPEYSGEDGEYVDGDIIDKFIIDGTKASLTGAKKVYLAFEAGRLKVKTSMAQTASLSVSNGIEYKQGGSSTITATYTISDMTSVILKHGADAVKTMPDKDHPSDVAADKQFVATYQTGEFQANDTYTLYYTPTEDSAGTVTATIPVLKRWYRWYSTTDGETTIPSGATSELRSSKPASMQCSASGTQYTYMAFPKSWSNVNPDNFKYDNTLNFEYGDATHTNETRDTSGFYGDSNDYIIVQSKQKGLNKTISF